MNKKIKPEDALSSCIRYYDNQSQEYYHSFNDELNQKPYDQGFLERFTSMLPNGSRILDAGCCSSAQQARFFRDKKFNVTAIDLSEKCIETAKNKFAGIQFQQMDMLQLTFEDVSFDAICAFYSIIHIPNEKTGTLFSGFNRVLKPGGKIAIAVHAGDFYGFFNENGIPVFYRTFTEEELSNALMQAGFQIDEMNRREPIYDFEFQSERIYLIAKKA